MTKKLFSNQTGSPAARNIIEACGLVLALALPSAARADTPTQPREFTSATQSSSAIQLTWFPALVGDGETRHQVPSLLYRDGSLIAGPADISIYVDIDLAPSTTYAYEVRGQDVDGTIGPAASVSGSTADLCGSPCSLFVSSAGPRFESYDPTGEIELGVLFNSDVDGTITGIRFYKGSLDTASHTVSLWVSDGTLLGTASAPGSEGFGFQVINFDQPVPISANATYVASYHNLSPQFHGGLTDHYFDTGGPDNVPLHTLGANGWYHQGPSGFPDQEAPDGRNFWVDVIFIPSP